MEVKGFSSRFLGQAEQEKSKSFEKLSSGKRINRASDDAAGLAIVAALESSVRSTAQASRNISDGVSLTQIVDSSLEQINTLNARKQELAAQAANGTLSDAQRASLNDEYQAANEEIDRIAQTTSFNGQNLLSGSSEITLQVGTEADANSQITLNFSNVAATPGDISTQAGAQAALDSSQTAISDVSQLRGQIGSVVNRLEAAQSNNSSRIENEQAAASRIRDVDVANETANLTRNKILSEASVAIQAQANISQSQVLKLLN